jgi:hypothetical protein
VGPADEEFDAYVRFRTPALLRSAYLLTGDQHLADDQVLHQWTEPESEHCHATATSTVLGLGAGTTEDPVAAERGSLIAYGPPLSDDGTAWLGTAALVQVLNPAAARAVLAPGRYAAVEVHNWDFGGRR